MEITEQNDRSAAAPSLRMIIGVILAGFLLSLIVTLAMFNSLSKIQLLLGESVIVLPAVAYVLAKGFSFTSTFRLRLVNRQVMAASAVLSLAVIVIVDEVDRIVSKFIEMPPEWEELLKRLLRAESFSDWIILIIAAVILAAILEEMLFRGLLQRALERRLEIPYAIFFSALTFAMLHLTPWLIQVLVLGLILGFLSWRSQSIVPGIILHALNNAFSLAQVNLESVHVNWYDWRGHVNPTVLVIAFATSYYTFKWFLDATRRDHAGPADSQVSTF